MKKSKSVDSHEIAELFKEQPFDRLSPWIGRVPGGSSRDDNIVLAIGTIILAMLIGSLFVLIKLL